MTPSTTNTAALELLPCPFCGSEPQLDDCRTIWAVRCDCGACVLGERAEEPEGDEPQEHWDRIRDTAIAAWNRRTLTQQQGGEQEADGLPELPEPNRVIEGAMASMDVDLFTTDQMREYALAALRSKPAASEGDGPTPQVGTARYMDGQYWFPQSAMERFGLAVADAREKRLANTSKQAAVEAVDDETDELLCQCLRIARKLNDSDGSSYLTLSAEILTVIERARSPRTGISMFRAPRWADPTTPPRHPADEGASANSYYAEKAREQGDVAVLDKYADIARALGFPCDTWFGDPLASHEDIVARAKALAALQAGTP